MTPPPRPTTSPPTSLRRHLSEALFTAALAATLAGAAVLAIYQQGYVFTWDSNMYLIFADMFAQGYPDRESSYAPLTIWSLGALRRLLGDFPASLNAYFFIVWFAWFWLVSRAAGGALLAGALAFVVLFGNPVVLEQFAIVLSEPAYSVLFSIAFVSLLALVLPAGRQKAPPAGWQAAFLIALALLPVQRYAGAFVAVFLGAAYLVAQPGLQRLRRLALATLPGLFVLFWNLRATGHPTGYREPSHRGFAENMATLGDTIGATFRPELAMFALLVALLGLLWHRQTRDTARGRRMRAGIAVALALLSIPAPLVLQAWTAARIDLDPLTTRFVVVLVPVIVAGLILAVAGLIRPALAPRPLAREAFWAVLLLALVPVSARFEWELGETPAHARSYPEVQHFLARLGPGEVAVIADGTRHLLAADILLDRFAEPGGTCSRFATRGSFWEESFHFATECNARGPELYPLTTDSWPALARRFPAAIIGRVDTDLPASPLLTTIPACARVETSRYLTLVDLRPCAAASGPDPDARPDTGADTGRETGPETAPPPPASADSPAPAAPDRPRP